MKSIGSQIAWFVGLVVLQVLVLNHIQLAYLINPFAYIYLILILPIHQSKTANVVIGFALGLAIDLFSSTWGLHAAASTLIAYIRPLALRIFADPEQLEKEAPSFGLMGGNFILYALSLIFIHHLLLFLLEAFSFSLLPVTLLKTLVSSLLTILIVMAFETIKNSRSHDKR